MALPNYISLSRHNVYYFRYPLPKELHPQHKNSHVRLSLRTSNQREAMVIANMLSYHAETILRKLRTTRMNYEQIRSTVKEGLNRLVEDGRTARLKSGAMNKSERKSMQEWLDQFQSYDVEDYYEGDTIVDVSERKITELFPDLDLTPEQREQFNKEFIRQYPEALKSLLAFNDNPQDIKFTGNTAEQSLKTRTPLNEAIEKYIAWQLKGNNWSSHTEGERRRYFTTLTDILGQNFITETLSKANAVKVQDIIEALPKNWKTRAKGKTITQAVQIDGLEKISSKTVNEHTSTYAAFCSWLVRRDIIEKNPFEGMKLDITEREKPRDDFSPEQMKTILNAIERDSIKNGRLNYRYWVTLIAAYTGARLGEVTQLHVEDIIQKDGVWCFDFNGNGETKHLKNKSSQRILPIHQKILDSGFIEYVDDIRSKGYKHLFPKIKYSKAHRYTQAMTVWFNTKFLPELGLKTDKLVFHSMRHTITTQLLEAGTNDSLVKMIRGSSLGKDSTFAHYDHSKRLGLMKEALEKLPY